MCSLIGAFLIAVGLYLVLWGKRADNNIVVGQSDEIGKDESADDSKVLEISTNDVPMLNPDSPNGRRT